ncbi:MAG: hypothetical protein ABEJ04_00240 [Halobacteriaceae archaeon]
MNGVAAGTLRVRDDADASGGRGGPGGLPFGAGAALLALSVGSTLFLLVGAVAVGRVR